MEIVRTPIADRDSWLALRQQDVTASVAGALLGVHEYTTAFELWALKSRLLSEDPTETPAMRRGRLLEDDALQILAEERSDWRIEAANNVYLRAPALRIGCTPDAYAVEPSEADIAKHGQAVLDRITATEAKLDALLAPDGPLASVMEENRALHAEATNDLDRRLADRCRVAELEAELASVMWERDEAQRKNQEAGAASCALLVAFTSWLNRALAAEAELATLKAAASRDGEAARQEIAGLRAALEAAETRFSDIAAGRAFQPRPHAATGATEARAALTTTETRDA